MKLELAQIAEWLNVAPSTGSAATGYSIDTRTLDAGDLFFAVVGERTDGHEYVEQALEKGAVAAVVRSDFNADGPLLRVSSPEAALLELAGHARQNWGRPVVGITGSNGKTSTKNAAAAMLATAMDVSSTQGNLNNELGAPLTLLRIRDESQAAVVEMGMNHAGEIRRIARAAKPTVGIVTNVSEAHIGAFQSVDEVALAKRELIEELDGTAVLNADDERVAAFREVHSGPVITFGLGPNADFRAVDINVSEGGSEFTLDSLRFRTNLIGEHGVRNILAAVAAASAFDIRPANLVEAVAALEPTDQRGAWREIRGVRILDDCYNSNPAAAEAMLDYLASLEGKRKVAVLGEMRELGAQSLALHRRVGERVKANGVDLLVAVGAFAHEMVEGAGRGVWFSDSDEAGRHLGDLLQPGDVALFKASRGVALERALESFASNRAGDS